MTLFMYSKLGKLGYVDREFCSVSESNSWRGSGAAVDLLTPQRVPPCLL